MAVLTPDEVTQLSPSCRVLELGCGPLKRVPHSVTVDFNPKSVADVIHDLNVLPYPFPDNEFDIVIAEHVMEHLDDLLKIYEELHRIIKPGGVLYIEVPHFSSSNFFTDPTHRHAFSSRSFDYFDPEAILSRFHYSEAQFRRKRIHIGSGESKPISRAIGRWINRHQALYEQRLAFIFPKETLNFELEVIK